MASQEPVKPKPPTPESLIPFDEMTFHTTPNYLTLLRIAFVPTVIGALWVKTPLWDFIAAVLFGLASITDYFDGYLARKYKIETVYGKLMDPLADKFLVICTLIMLQDLGRMSAIVVMLLVCRELTITGLRALASAEGVIVSASQGGKWKTATQMIAIPCLMIRDVTIPLADPITIPFFEIGRWLTYFSLALSIWSAKDYMVDFFIGLKKSREMRRQKKLMKRAEKKARRKKRTFL
jgi:CDP-diacylglycerol--glycerol-3-phosphate 3-phosphatidyltransferase